MIMKVINNDYTVIWEYSKKNTLRDPKALGDRSSDRGDP